MRSPAGRVGPGAGPRARWAAALLAAALALPGCVDGPAARGGAGDSSGGASASDSALRRVARELLPELERRSGLEARRPPRLARRSRAELEAFLEEELSEQLPREEAEALRATYARLGLVPDTLDLHSLLRRLYMEQVVGYYDPAADTLFVLEDVGAGEARTVLVHELVHALQDQHVDLDSLTDALEESNDRSNAARAAIEGQATFVMAEWAVARGSGSDVDLTETPGVAEKFAEVASGAAPEGMPAFSSAPRVVRETLTFPYVGGLRYVMALWGREGSRPAPFGGRLPASTEQVLHPGRGPGGDRDAPTRVRFRAEPPEGWDEVYAHGMGELETRIFLSVHLAADSLARPAAAGWDGDRLRLLRSGGREALLWVSVWDDAAEADAFAAAARGAFEERYGAGSGRRVAVRRLSLDGRPGGVRVVDAPEGVPTSAVAPAARVELSERPGRDPGAGGR